MERKIIGPGDSQFDPAIDKEKFTFVQRGGKIYDSKFQTKKIGFFKDAIIRFSKNRGSVIASIILLLLILYSLIVPAVSSYGVGDYDQYYTNCLPKVSADAKGFWDGTEKKSVKSEMYYYYLGFGAIVSTEGSYTYYSEDMGKDITMYNVILDTYIVGFKFDTIKKDVLDELIAYDKTVDDSKKILGPMVEYSYIDSLDIDVYTKSTLKSFLARDANYYYQVDRKHNPITDSQGNIISLYVTDSSGNYEYYTQFTDSQGNPTNTYQIRMNYDNYYIYKNGHKPYHILGSDRTGYDIFTRLAYGGRLSLILGVVVASINIILGIIYGAIEGYYGGATDLMMERFSDILSCLPSIVVVALFNMHLTAYVGPVLSLLFAFVSTGWIGTGSTVRMQFYRYKNQEYILAARTLGAKDNRLIFRHILPNAIGPVVTSSVLMIPGVIFSESMLSYLNIINLSSRSTTSIGTMLSEGQSTFTTYPNNILWPCLFISLLMICFNVFGNGLRDAFNPSLRGSGE